VSIVSSLFLRLPTQAVAGFREGSGVCKPFLCRLNRLVNRKNSCDGSSDKTDGEKANGGFETHDRLITIQCFGTLLRWPLKFRPREGRVVPNTLNALRDKTDLSKMVPEAQKFLGIVFMH